MAEGWLRHLAGDDLDVYSAGVNPGTLNPLAVRAMNEVGVNIADHKAEGVDTYLGKIIVDYLVIVCDKASQTCPRVWPGLRERMFWPFDDPSSAQGSDEEKLEVFRRVRDEIKAKIENWLIEVQQTMTR
jgi:arsenate reductase